MTWRGKRVEKGFEVVADRFSGRLRAGTTQEFLYTLAPASSHAANSYPNSPYNLYGQAEIEIFEISMGRVAKLHLAFFSLLLV